MCERYIEQELRVGRRVVLMQILQVESRLWMRSDILRHVTVASAGQQGAGGCPVKAQNGALVQVL
jgi:hypothetical protein